MTETEQDKIDALRSACARAINQLADTMQFPTLARKDMQRCLEKVIHAAQLARELDPEDE